jgi:hypothetical protein
MDIAQNAIKASYLDTIEGKVIIFLNTYNTQKKGSVPPNGGVPYIRCGKNIVEWSPAKSNGECGGKTRRNGSGNSDAI